MTDEPPIENNDPAAAGTVTGSENRSVIGDYNNADFTKLVGVEQSKTQAEAEARLEAGELVWIITDEPPIYGADGWAESGWLRMPDYAADGEWSVLAFPDKPGFLSAPVGLVVKHFGICARELRRRRWWKYDPTFEEEVALLADVGRGDRCDLRSGLLWRAHNRAAEEFSPPNKLRNVVLRSMAIPGGEKVIAWFSYEPRGC
ncbi:MAG: hypothetical protein CMM61_12075 [Rhodospirillaceae bacterium]|nr:hypothetical protein [Rhodospirillaceae bacterium]